MLPVTTVYTAARNIHVDIWDWLRRIDIVMIQSRYNGHKRHRELMATGGDRRGGRGPAARARAER